MLHIHTAIIIDDEPDAISSLQKAIHLYISNVKVVAIGASVQEGIQRIKAFEPDIVFLDVLMKDGTGFDLLDQLPAVDFKLIVTTAYDQFALKAFRYHAIDYLLKPINPTYLEQACNKAKDNIHGLQFDQLAALSSAFKHKTIEKIAFNTGEGILLLSINEICHLQAQENYTTIHLLDGQKHLLTKTMKEVASNLPEESFHRIHHSHIVQLRSVRKFIKEDGGYALMENGSKIPVSRRKKELFLKKLINATF